MDIKRLPDGTSRGFAFVKFSDTEAPYELILISWVFGVKRGGGVMFGCDDAEVGREENKGMREISGMG